MIKFNSTRFGELSVPEDKIITFKEGIPGFPYAKRYVLLDYKDTVLKWLQSVDDPDLAFIVTESSNIDPKYQIIVHNSVKEYLEVDNDESLVVLLILRIHEGKVIANFNGPLIINADKMLGAQVIVESI
jgi:flagellar assembly factor FliW